MTNIKQLSADVVVVNHGQVFGHKNWYTFYCPECKRQVEGKQNKCGCGLHLIWKDTPK